MIYLFSVAAGLVGGFAAVLLLDVYKRQSQT